MGEPTPNPVAVAQAKIYEEKVLMTVLVSRADMHRLMEQLPEGTLYHMQDTNLKTLSNRKRADSLGVAIAISFSRAAQRIIEEIVG